jgi:hypothetical protein
LDTATLEPLYRAPACGCARAYGSKEGISFRILIAMLKRRSSALRGQFVVEARSSARVVSFWLSSSTEMHARRVDERASSFILELWLEVYRWKCDQFADLITLRLWLREGLRQ